MTTASEVLREGFDRHIWATAKLLDHLATLDAPALAQTTPGTYGSIVATMTHLVEADDRYLQRLGRPDLPPYQEREPQAPGELGARFREHAARWTAALDRLDAGELHAVIPPDRVPGGVDPAETLLLLQALHHGDDHRAQVCSILGALGLEAPDLDVWTYWDEVRAG
jgi:uncharacterized damage-inducible protein DinB